MKSMSEVPAENRYGVVDMGYVCMPVYMYACMYVCMGVYMGVSPIFHYIYRSTIPQTLKD